MGIRYSPGCSDCGCGCVVRITVVDWCDGDAVVDFVGIKVYEVVDGERGDLVLEANTGSSGVLATELGPGDYIVEATKDGYHGYNTIRALECGTNTLKLTTGAGVTFDVFGCNDPITEYPGPLSDAKIQITGPRAYELQTVDGTVIWYPEESGSYHVTVTHPSGMFEPWEDDRTITACTSTSVTVHLEPVEGAACCYSDYGKDPADAVPQGRILVTTSAGDSWYLEGDEPCYSVHLTTSEDGQLIASTATPSTGEVYPTELGDPCEFDDFPADLHEGAVGVKVKIRYPMILNDGSGEYGFNAELAPPLTGNLRRLDPMTFDYCQGLIDGSATETEKSWYVGTVPYGGPTLDIGWTWLGVATVLSYNPLSVEIEFGTGGPECWSWHGAYGGTRDCQAPPPIRSITLTEEV